MIYLHFFPQQSMINGHVRKKKNKKKGGRGQKGGTLHHVLWSCDYHVIPIVALHLKMSTVNLWREMVDKMDYYYKFSMK